MMRVALICLACATAYAQPLDGQGRSMLNPVREDALHPTELIARLHLAPDASIADVGAGPGFLTIPLARAVSKGKVVAGDVREDYLAVVRDRARTVGVSNVETRVWPADRPLLAPGSVDVAVLCQVDQYFKDRVAYVTALLPSLKRGGRILFVNFDRHRAADVEAARKLGLVLVDEWTPSTGFFALLYQR